MLVALLVIGFRGRQQARVEAEIQDIGVVRDRLQKRLDEQQPPIDQMIEGASGVIPRERWPTSSDNQTRGLMGALRARLDKFEANHGMVAASGAERLDVRLGQATLANAERRFADALSIIPVQDSQGERAEAGHQRERLARVYQVRGDAFYGQQAWREALENYQQLLVLQPKGLGTMTRVVECQLALGGRNDSLTAYGALGRGHQRRAVALSRQGKRPAALAHYQQAIGIYSRLVEKEGLREFAPELQATQVKMEKLLSEAPGR